MEELFDERNKESFEKYWKALISENAPIVFYYLPLKNFGLTDELYIKMNARGKQLTSFENFKADLIGYIERKAKENCAWRSFLDIERGIPLKLDTTWTDIFWEKAASNGEIDKIYFAFLNRYFLNCAIIYNNAKETSKEWKLYGNKSDDSLLGYNNGFDDIYAAILSRLEVLENLSTLFKHLAEAKEDVKEYLPKWFGEFDFIPKYTGNTISTLTQTQRVVFFGVCRYLESCSTFNERRFRRWMRVVCNLAENTTINTVDAMVARLKLIDELSKHVENIYEYLASEDFKIQSKASPEQLGEEIAKAKQILKPQEAQLPERPTDWSDDKEWNWESAISEAEGYAFFNGAIRFLFRNKNNKWEWNNFTTKWRNAQFLFGEKGFYKNKSTLLRYFISKFTEWDMFWGITFDSTQSSWRSNLLDDKWSCPIDEMLCSSSFEVNPDYHSSFEGKQKAVQEELVISGLLDYIERGCHLNYRDNDIYILYPYNAKADWKKYIIADKRNKLLSTLYGGCIDLSNKQLGKIYTNQKIEGCDFFWGWDIHFIYVDDAEYAFRWQHWNRIDLYEDNKRLYEENNNLTINGSEIKDEKDLVEKMDQCIDRYRNSKGNADQLSINFLHISDTHSQHRRLTELPDADILIHSGDFTMNGSEQEAIDFMNWFCDLPYPHKIFICGNHDVCLYGANIDGLDENVHYLCNSGVVIDGVKYYGVPMFMEDCISDRQTRNYAAIPADTDVLITHCPPYGVLDFDDGINYGSAELLVRVEEIKPCLHLFGHIHKQHGVEKHGSTVFSNGAIMNGDYTSFNFPNLIEI